MDLHNSDDIMFAFSVPSIDLILVLHIDPCWNVETDVEIRLWEGAD